VRQRKGNVALANARKLRRKIGKMVRDEMDHLAFALDAAAHRHHACRQDDARIPARGKEFRRTVGKSLRNETVRTFLLHEFDQFSFGYRADGTAPIQNKVGAFLADPLLNRILTAPEKDLRIRQVMDKG
jgi:hypothetical protein